MGAALGLGGCELPASIHAELSDSTWRDQWGEDWPACGLDEGGDEPFAFAMSHEIDAGETEGEATEAHVGMIRRRERRACA